jgi:ADP-ribose pyrophosphatase YjhB (NUDIX family)
MKIYINDNPFRIIPAKKNVILKNYDTILAEAKTNIDFNTFSGDVLIQHAPVQIIDQYLQLLKSNNNKKIDSITFQVDNFQEAVKHIKEEYTFIEAAGGVVENNSNILMIYRLKKWDLPKGKKDNKEKIKETAVREVEEECNIKVKLLEKVCNTYHTYKRNGKNILKKTSWYRMKCLDDSNLKPEAKEQIEEVRWMAPDEIKAALYNSYPSIREVFRKYYQVLGSR